MHPIMANNTLIPKKISLKKQQNKLYIHYCFPDHHFILDAEYLRVHSPIHKNEKHNGPISGKQYVQLINAQCVGRYALKLTFDDHDHALYTWPYLHQLCVHQSIYWADYLRDLHQAQLNRHPEISVIKWMPS